MDFGALGGDGLVVPDLQASEVTVRIGGRRGTVRSLQLISAADPGGQPPVGSLPPPFGTNAAGERGRAFVLVIDDDSFRAGGEGPLREAVTAFVDQLSSRDQLSLVTMPSGGVKVPLTTDHSRTLSALMKIVGQATATETGSELACRTRRTLESLGGYLDGVVGTRAEVRERADTAAHARCELRLDLRDAEHLLRTDRLHLVADLSAKLRRIETR